MYKSKLNIFIFLVLGFFLYNVLPNIYRNYEKINILKEEKLDLQTKNRDIEKQIARIKEEIERLDDSFYVETLARERLSMVKKDEKIYRLVN